MLIFIGAATHKNEFNVHVNSEGSRDNAQMRSHSRTFAIRIFNEIGSEEASDREDVVK